MTSVSSRAQLCNIRRYLGFYGGADFEMFKLKIPRGHFFCTFLEPTIFMRAKLHVRVASDDPAGFSSHIIHCSNFYSADSPNTI